MTYSKGDRVMIEPVAGMLASRTVYGVVHKVVIKEPRGKLPGEWLTVHIDPPPGIRKWEIEIHASLVQPEDPTDDGTGYTHERITGASDCEHLR